MRRRQIGLALTLFFLASALVYLLLPAASRYHLPIADGLPVLAAILATSAAVYAYHDLAFSERMRHALICFAIGIGLWTLGEATWFVYENILGVIEPYPSLADIFWIGGYPFLAMAAILGLRAFGSLLNWNTIFLSGTAILVILILAAWLLFIPIIQDASVSGTEKALDVAYPALDLVLLVATAIILGTVFRGLYAQPWLFISASLAAFALADLIFSYLTWHELYRTLRLPSVIADLGWIAGYLLLTKGLSDIRAVVTEKQS